MDSQPAVALPAEYDTGPSLDMVVPQQQGEKDSPGADSMNPGPVISTTTVAQTQPTPVVALRQVSRTLSNRGSFTSDAMPNPSPSAMPGVGDYNSAAREPLFLHWRHLSYCVQAKDPKTKVVAQKCILKDVSAYAKPGEMLALLGASGAGKSTLLNLIAGRLHDGTMYGTIQVNHYRPSLTTAIVRRLGSYVMQADLMLTTLTPRELLTFNARLKGVPLHRVDTVIEDLGLGIAQNTMIRRISGGQLKRVAIANELLDERTSAILLDEPTSGLDASTAFDTMQLLQTLAKRNNITVIVTIHQPAWSILELFDRLMLLADARVVYFGPLNESISYFDYIGYPVGKYANPGDHFIAVSKRVPAKELALAYERSPIAKSEMKFIDTYRASAPEADHKPPKRHMVHPLLATVILTQRQLLANFREPLTSAARFFQTLVMGFFVAVIFWQLGTNQKSIQSRTGAVFFVATNAAFSAMAAIVLVFPRERPIFQREYSAGLYGTLPYYIAKLMGDMPFLVLSPLLLLLIVYWAVDFRGGAFGWYILITQVEVQAAAAIGYLISTSASNADVAAALMPVIMLPTMLLGGLFLNLDTLPRWLIPFKYLSLIFYSFNGLVDAEYANRTFYCDGGELRDGVCPVTTGQQVKDDLGIEFTVGECALLLLALAVGFRILAYILLWLSVHGLRGRKGVQSSQEAFDPDAQCAACAATDDSAINSGAHSSHSVGKPQDVTIQIDPYNSGSSSSLK